MKRFLLCLFVSASMIACTSETKTETKNEDPLSGTFVSKDEKAYAYLPESVAAFPEGKAFTDILSKLGYKQVDATLVSGGIATIYSGIK